MYIPKRYGQSRVESCPFCGKQGIQENKQGVAVCIEHKQSTFDDFKCVCGDYLDLKKGKYGVFFSCMKCGTMNLRKALEINQIKAVSSSQPAKKDAEESGPQEMIVRSDDPRFFD